MSTISLPNVRQESDIKFIVKLKDNGVAIDWSGLSNISAYAFSDVQKRLAGTLQCSVDSNDSTKLIVIYSASLPQYLGVCKLIVRATYQNRKKTYDKAVCNFVATTGAATGVTVITDPEINVNIDVAEVSTSLLDNAIDACIAATADCVAANSIIWLDGSETAADIYALVSAKKTVFYKDASGNIYDVTKSSSQSAYLTSVEGLTVYRIVVTTAWASSTFVAASSDALSSAVNRIGTIEGVIPSAAAQDNKLADKNFVNSSISTATAAFRGTFQLFGNNRQPFAVIDGNDNRCLNICDWAYDGSAPSEPGEGNAFFSSDLSQLKCYRNGEEEELTLAEFDWESATENWLTTNISRHGVAIPLYYFWDSDRSERYVEIKGSDLYTLCGSNVLNFYPWQDDDKEKAFYADDNDYAFTNEESSGNSCYKRWKYSNDSWLYEYTLNNSSFTAAQWAAINSGISDSMIPSGTGANNKLVNNTQLGGLKFASVSALPASPDANTIYFITE